MLNKLANTSASSVGLVSNVESCIALRAPGDQLPHQVLADLRTDHAGEVGAVCIYLGALFITRDPVLRAFAQHHLSTERSHLTQIETWLPKNHFSLLLPLWRLAGFVTGAMPALFGSKAVYATIEAVETFVDLHYEEQVRALVSQPELDTLRLTLLQCQADEVKHREEAAQAYGTDKHGFVLRLWCALVDAGSRGAVAVCRHI
jgi:ubiquinone biosynthesis monooxygenase Coq7